MRYFQRWRLGAWILWFGLVGFCFAGCASPAAQTAQPSPIIIPNATSTPTIPATHALPTLVPVSATHTASPTLFPTQTATSTPTPTPFPPPLCSPLQEHTFSDLREIVSRGVNFPPQGKDEGHHGVDFAYYRFKERGDIGGVPIQSVFEGRVAGVVRDRWPYGNVIIIESRAEQLPDFVRETFGISLGASLYTLYAHMEASPMQDVGDAVACGDVLGAVGNTGWSGNVHLHLEMRVGNADETLPSMAYYITTSTSEERATYERWRMSGAFALVDPILIFQGE